MSKHHTQDENVYNAAVRPGQIHANKVTAPANAPVPANQDSSSNIAQSNGVNVQQNTESGRGRAVRPVLRNIPADNQAANRQYFQEGAANRATGDVAKPVANQDAAQVHPPQLEANPGPKRSREYDGANAGFTRSAKRSASHARTMHTDDQDHLDCLDAVDNDSTVNTRPVAVPVPQEVRHVLPPAEVSRIRRMFCIESLRLEGIEPYPAPGVSPYEFPTDSYSNEIAMDASSAADSQYMAQQEDISPRMREVLVDWIHAVVMKFKLRRETLFLCISIIDRFLARRSLARTQLQLVGLAAMLIASKYEELYTPDVNDFVLIAESAYSREEILTMELLILDVLEFRFTIPASIRFMDRMLRVAHTVIWGPSFPSLESHAREQGVNQFFDAEIHPGSILSSTAVGSKAKVSRSYALCNDISNYICELVLQEYSCLQFPAWLIGCASVVIALKVTGKSCWNNFMEEYSGIPGDRVRVCISAIEDVIKKPTRYQTVRQKYATQLRNEASKVIGSFFNNPENGNDLFQDIVISM